MLNRKTNFKENSPRNHVKRVKSAYPSNDFNFQNNRKLVSSKNTTKRQSSKKFMIRNVKTVKKDNFKQLINVFKDEDISNSKKKIEADRLYR